MPLTLWQAWSVAHGDLADPLTLHAISNVSLETSRKHTPCVQTTVKDGGRVETNGGYCGLIGQTLILFIRAAGFAELQAGPAGVGG